MIEERHLTILGRYLYESIPTITQFVADAAAAAGLGPDEVFHCQMAADEACTNIFEHAYEEQANDNIEITCQVETGRCTIIILDHGQPFDPESVPVPTISTNIEDIEPGGIGLHLMRKLMDDIRFEFGEDGNRLTMVKSHQKDNATPENIITQRQLDKGVWVVAISGRLDSTHAADIETTLRELLDRGQHWLVVDLAEVSYISSRGLKALVTSWRRATDSGGTVVLCSIQPRVLTIFETVGFTEVFKTYPALDDAVAALTSAKK